MVTTMTDPDLAQLESAATPGPWEAVPERYLARGDWGIFAPGGRVIATVPVNLVLRANEAERKQFAADAALIVAARNELPQLLTELTRLRAIEVASIAAEQRVKELEDVVDAVRQWGEYTPRRVARALAALTGTEPGEGT